MHIRAIGDSQHLLDLLRAASDEPGSHETKNQKTKRTRSDISDEEDEDSDKNTTKKGKEKRRKQNNNSDEDNETDNNNNNNKDKRRTTRSSSNNNNNAIKLNINWKARDLIVVRPRGKTTSLFWICKINKVLPEESKLEITWFEPVEDDGDIYPLSFIIFFLFYLFLYILLIFYLFIYYLKIL